jgi:hypothetical protein
MLGVHGWGFSPGLQKVLLKQVRGKLINTSTILSLNFSAYYFNRYEEKMNKRSNSTKYTFTEFCRLLNREKNQELRVGPHSFKI